jgi:hypothetical protein
MEVEKFVHYYEEEYFNVMMPHYVAFPGLAGTPYKNDDPFTVSLGLKFSFNMIHDNKWRLTFEVIDKKQYLLSKIKYGI